MKKIIINFCPTGVNPTKEMTPYVPIQPSEIADDTYEAYKLGASIVHIHARDENGKNTNSKEKYAEIIKLIREKCPDIIICTSLTGRLENTFEKRSDVLNLQGDLKPDMGSLTLSSLNFSNQESVNSPSIIKDLAKKMLDSGVKPELEVFDLGMVNMAKYLISKGLLKAPYYFNIMIGNLYSAQDSLNDISSIINNLPENSVFCLGGIGNCQRRVNYLGALYANGARVGLEDFIYDSEHRKKLVSNKFLVQRIANFCNDNGIGIMTPSEVRKLLNI
jgi:3-keto-5-aminohexanoate cleavage enzyme